MTNDTAPAPTVRSTTVKTAADLLIAAHRQGRQIAEAPGDCAPNSRDEAYAIQDLVRERLGPTAGWKTGAPTPQAEPIAAPLLASLTADSPAKLPARRFHMMGIEIELAFKLGRDLAPRGRPFGIDEVRDAVASVHAAVELVDSRLSDWQEASAHWRLADNQTNGFFVLGSGTTDWRDMDLAALPVQLEIDGAVAVKQEGGNSAGDPIRLLVHLVNHCCHRRGGLKAGDVVTTGSFTGLIFVTAPAKIHGEFTGIGHVAVTLAE